MDCVQILGLGTDTGDTTPSVLLFFDHLRFLFNVGEGFQRFCVQHRVKLAKTSGIFVTRTSTEAAGGLPGELPLKGSPTPETMCIVQSYAVKYLVSEITGLCPRQFGMKCSQGNKC